MFPGVDRVDFPQRHGAQLTVVVTMVTPRSPERSKVEGPIRAFLKETTEMLQKYIFCTTCLHSRRLGDQCCSAPACGDWTGFAGASESEKRALSGRKAVFVDPDVAARHYGPTAGQPWREASAETVQAVLSTLNRGYIGGGAAEDGSEEAGSSAASIGGTSSTAPLALITHSERACLAQRELLAWMKSIAPSTVSQRVIRGYRVKKAGTVSARNMICASELRTALLEVEATRIMNAQEPDKRRSQGSIFGHEAEVLDELLDCMARASEALAERRGEISLPTTPGMDRSAAGEAAQPPPPPPLWRLPPPSSSHWRPARDQGAAVEFDEPFGELVLRGSPDAIFQGMPVELKTVQKDLKLLSAQVATRYKLQIAAYQRTHAQGADCSPAIFLLVSLTTREVLAVEVSPQNFFGFALPKWNRVLANTMPRDPTGTSHWLLRYWNGAKEWAALPRYRDEAAEGQPSQEAMMPNRLQEVMLWLKEDILRVQERAVEVLEEVSFGVPRSGGGGGDGGGGGGGGGGGDRNGLVARLQASELDAVSTASLGALRELLPQAISDAARLRKALKGYKSLTTFLRSVDDVDRLLKAKVQQLVLILDGRGDTAQHADNDAKEALQWYEVAATLCSVPLFGPSERYDEISSKKRAARALVVVNSSRRGGAATASAAGAEAEITAAPEEERQRE